MINISNSRCVRCHFETDSVKIQGIGENITEVYYAETRSLYPCFSDFYKYISNDEKLRAKRFRFDEDKNTYISSHALLRLIIAKKLNTEPLALDFILGPYKKPGLKNDPLYFNLAHTREAFAIAVSWDFQLGIDLEELKQEVDIHSIIKTNFSPGECEFILRECNKIPERFFLLWTRKEALLKALGTGITDHLTQIEVSESDNYINSSLFDKKVTGFKIPDFFIYSKKYRNYYLSVAAPCMTLYSFKKVNKKMILSLLT